ARKRGCVVAGCLGPVCLDQDYSSLQCLFCRSKWNTIFGGSESASHGEFAGPLTSCATGDLERLRGNGGTAADHQSDVKRGDLHPLKRTGVGVSGAVPEIAVPLSCSLRSLRDLCELRG